MIASWNTASTACTTGPAFLEHTHIHVCPVANQSCDVALTAALHPPMFAYPLPAAAKPGRERSASTASRDGGSSRVGRGGYGVSAALASSSFSPGGAGAGRNRRSIASSMDSDADGDSAVGSPMKPMVGGRARGMSRGSGASMSEFDDADSERLYCTFCASSGSDDSNAAWGSR